MESGLKSRVKVFTQTIIGMYLCPGSRAEMAEKATGGKNGLKSRVKVFAQSAGYTCTSEAVLNNTHLLRLE
jgi:hypothetical protein